MSANERATIKDVALLAGVSISTVSLVVSQNPKVATKTKKKVQEAINNLQYVPNDYAVALRKTNKKTIAIIVPDINDAFYKGIIRLLRNQCNLHGIQLHIGETLYDYNIEKEEILFARNIQTMGYVFAGTLFDDPIISTLSSDKIIFLDKLNPSEKYPQIFINNRQSIYNATAHLISKGCRNIFYITQMTHTFALQERLEGYKNAMEEAGLSFEDNIYISDKSVLNKLEAGHSIADFIMDKTVPDGIITSSDLYALGAMKALNERGLSIPNDVSVIGFDDIDIAKYYIPSLTTIRQPVDKMSELAFNYLTGGSDVGSGRMTLHADFIIRDSVK